MNMGRVTLLASLFILAGASAEAAELRLRPEATVRGGMVRVADLAEVVGNGAAELQGVLLFPAPGPGKERIVRRGEIAELLALHDLPLAQHEFSGADQVVVRRGGGTSPAIDKGPATVEQSVAHALVSYLDSQQPGDWKVVPAIPPRYLAPLKDAKQITVSGGQAPFTGRQSFELLARIEGHERRIPIEADVASVKRAVVAVRAVPRGQTIGENDVQSQPLAADAAGDAELLSHEEVVGREAALPIRPGQVITAADVQLPRIIHRGDKVTIRSLAAGVSITTSGKATQDGALGESIAVELEDPKRQILAKVTGPLGVEVGSPEPPAAEHAASLRPTRVEPIGATR